jgi:hypothetical protein
LDTQKYAGNRGGARGFYGEKYDISIFVLFRKPVTILEYAGARFLTD